MKPNMEQPKQYTLEEMAQLEKSRTISDADLLDDGAKYVKDKDGGKRLKVTKEQIEKWQIRKEISLYGSAIKEHLEEIQKEFSGFLKRNSSSVRMHVVFQPWANDNYGSMQVSSQHNASPEKVHEEMISYTKDLNLYVNSAKGSFLEFGDHDSWGRKFSCGLENIKSIKSGASGEVFDIEKIVGEAEERENK